MRQKLVILSTIFLGTQLSWAQHKYMVKYQAHDVGTASLSQRIQTDGSKIVELLMTMKQGSQKVFVRTRSEYARDGKPRRMFQVMTSTNPTKRRQTNVEFEPDGAITYRDEGNGGKRQKVEISKNDQTAAISEFWFLRDVPLKGDSCKAFIFDLDQLRWDIRTTTFEGSVQIDHGGRKLWANRVVTEHNSDSVVAYIDSKGWPIRIESGDTVIEREEH